MKKLLIVSLLLSFQSCFAAQESIRQAALEIIHDHDARITIVTKELSKPSTKYLLSSAALIGAGVCLNNAVLPEQDSMAHTLLTDVAIALPYVSAGYAMGACMDYEKRREACLKFTAAYCGFFLLFGIGAIFELNALSDCPLFSIPPYVFLNDSNSLLKDSDDFYSFQCINPDSFSERSLGTMVGEELILVIAGVVLRQSVMSRLEEFREQGYRNNRLLRARERNQRELLLPNQENIDNVEVLSSDEIGIELVAPQNELDALLSAQEQV